MTTLQVSMPVRALVRKELREYRRHRMIMLTAVILPIAFLVLPIVNLVLFNAETSLGGVDLAVGQAMFCFFLTPVIIPATMAAFSVIGERDQGTLEPLLTLPLSDREFLAGKVFAIVAPAVLVSFGIYLVYTGIAFVGTEGEIRAATLDWTWPFGFFLLTPLLAGFSTLAGMAFSVRARDIRVAEHLSGLVLLPSMLPLMLVVTQAIPARPVTWLALAAALVLIDATLWRLALRAFDRERAISAS
ncbi:MAG: ABC transporter permease [Dehalococcoidia bacterium]|nr:ABC transporter permease [Dehalococcoidia bacterium]